MAACAGVPIEDLKNEQRLGFFVLKELQLFIRSWFMRLLGLLLPELCQQTPGGL
jgi:hypothetical protein